jgi:acyl carrier protein/GNAT superfamily N-acetyltransferase
MTTTHRAELQRALESWGVDPADLADEHNSLIGAGLLDSLALFNLSVWLEERIGRPIDPAKLDVLTQWDSIASILHFIERHGEVDAASAGAQARLPAAPMRPATVAHDERYRIVRYEPRQRNDAARLLCGLWSPDPELNAAVFRWKYEDNPFAGETLIYLALHGERAVAIRAFCRSAWEGDASAPAHTPYVADDLVVEEEHRNHGLFNLFTEAALADLRSRGEHMFLSLSALRVTRLQLLASGSRSVGVLPTIALRPAWLRAVDAIVDRIAKAPLLWRLVEGWMPGGRAERSFQRLDALRVPIERDGLRIEITADPPAEQLAALVARIEHGGRLRHRRDARFFAWRYRHPLHAYRLLIARRDARVVGYLVLQRGRSAYANPRRVNIVDWACERPDVLASLVQAARDAGGIVDLVTWSNPTDAAVFERLGFQPADAHQASRGLPCVLVRSIAAAPADEPRLAGKPMLDLASWDLRMAYTSFA